MTLVAQSASDGNGLLDTIITVGAAEATHCTSHSATLVSFVTVKAGSIAAATTQTLSSSFIADDGDTKVVAEAGSMLIRQGNHGQSQSLARLEVDRGVVMGMSLLGVSEITRLLHRCNVLWSFCDSILLRWNILWKLATLRFGFAAANTRMDCVLGRV